MPFWRGGQTDRAYTRRGEEIMSPALDEELREAAVSFLPQTKPPRKCSVDASPILASKIHNWCFQTTACKFLQVLCAYSQPLLCRTRSLTPGHKKNSCYCGGGSSGITSLAKTKAFDWMDAGGLKLERL